MSRLNAGLKLASFRKPKGIVFDSEAKTGLCYIYKGSTMREEKEK